MLLTIMFSLRASQSISLKFVVVVVVVVVASFVVVSGVIPVLCKKLYNTVLVNCKYDLYCT